MEEGNEESIAQLFGLEGKKKNKKKNNSKAKNKAETVPLLAENSAIAANNGGDSSGVRISMFDYSVENFFRYMDTIAKLCGEEDDANLEQSEDQRLSSSVTFLRQWRDYNYEPRSIKFAYGAGSSDRKDVSSINLPQFSSATVPKEGQLGDAASPESRDFVMYVGGPVWALDWCPQRDEKLDCPVKCEFIAVAAHPPGASYHKMGATLTGRGVIQIWCLLHIKENSEEVSPLTEKGRKRLKKDGGTNDMSTKIKGPRGRPRKKPIEIAGDNTTCETQDMQALVVRLPENSADFLGADRNPENNEEISPTTDNRKRGARRKDGGTNDMSTKIKRPRGRPRKKPIEIAGDNTNCETQDIQALFVRLPGNSAEFIAADGNLGNNEEISPTTDNRKTGAKEKMKSEQIKRLRGRPKKNSKEVTAGDTNWQNQSVRDLAVIFPEDSTDFLSPDVVHSNCNEYGSQQISDTEQMQAKTTSSVCNTMPKIRVKRSGLKTNHREVRYNHVTSQPLLTRCEGEANHQPHCGSELGPLAANCSIPGDVTLPRLVSCLAHNGRVVWDVKWRPPQISDSLCKTRMGYLAVLLGNGSLEVWDIPLPRALRAIYMHRETTDPRFIKLEPVFKCSMLKRGDSLQSIPLTVEWSVTPPHDYLVAGCHDGTVALWKFSTNASSKCDDTKPLLCFVADTVPIRAVAWAPYEGDPESSNIILTAGHEGLKFWDLRNPFRPLRKIHPVPRIIYSVDWLSNPSCIIMSFEDGTMRTLGLVKAANDLPVSGNIYSGKKQPGLHGVSCSSFAIWSVHVSRLTGMVAYGGADGNVIRYQLTTKAVETDHADNRIPRFLCGSVTEDESTLVINSPVPNTPFQWRKSFEKGRLSSFREFLSGSNLSKSANNQMAKVSSSESQTLALCDGNDLGVESGSEEALASVEPKKPKLSRCKKKKPAESLALVCRDDESTSTLVADNEKSDSGSTPEVFPSKMAALHRVRWNMNKGSERWLCYGGAAGVVRCQEIVFNDIERKRVLKR